MSSIIGIGAAGIRAAEARLEQSASRIARSGVQPEAGAPEVDLAAEVVSTMTAATEFKASAKLVEVGRDLMKTTLDILA